MSWTCSKCGSTNGDDNAAVFEGRRNVNPGRNSRDPGVLPAISFVVYCRPA